VTDCIFMTGSTGYLGSYVCAELLQDPDIRLVVLVRGADDRARIAKLWKAWQLHLDFDQFVEHMQRVRVVAGDLHAPGLGLSDEDRSWVDDCDSILHIAATLNRKSSKSCFNTNLRGSLSLLKVAREIQDRKGLDRFGFVSTAAIAGHRQSEDLTEEQALDWDRSDYDPYARTKKFCEHMVTELLPDVRTTIYRPSIVMGDANRPETSQFDMIFATCMLADLPALPLDPHGRVDIVNADWVGRAIATLHKLDDPEPVYHLSAGRDSVSVKDITDALDAHRGTRTRFAPRLEWAWNRAYRAANRMPRGWTARGIGSLWKVFWPYVTYDTVFLNDRAVRDVGVSPVPFTDYFPPLYDWVKAHEYRYPHLPLPEDA
jgi:nucleoside-diphosphate-sugar epimerase